MGKAALQLTATPGDSSPALRQGAAPDPGILSPRADVWLLGGVSLVLYALSYVFVDRMTASPSAVRVAVVLAYIVNNPHFMASYLLLYWDRRAELLRQPRFVWAGLVAPALMIGLVVAGIALGRPELIGALITAKFAMVGWHYVNQTYGVMMVANGRRGYLLPRHEGRLLKLHLTCLWMAMFLHMNLKSGLVSYYGINYWSLGVPVELTWINYTLAGLTLAALIWLGVRRWARDGALPAASGLVALAALYAWYFPPIAHSTFWVLVPLFHSLQYLPFVGAMKRADYFAAVPPVAADPARAALRRRGALHGAAFIGVSVLLGALTFHWLPEALNTWVDYDKAAFGPSLFLAVFLGIINVHHFIIDSVIWRRGDGRLKALFAKA